MAKPTLTQLLEKVRGQLADAMTENRALRQRLESRDKSLDEARKRISQLKEAVARQGHTISRQQGYLLRVAEDDRIRDGEAGTVKHVSQPEVSEEPIRRGPEEAEAMTLKIRHSNTLGYHPDDDFKWWDV